MITSINIPRTIRTLLILLIELMSIILHFFCHRHRQEQLLYGLAFGPGATKVCCVTRWSAKTSCLIQWIWDLFFWDNFSRKAPWKIWGIYGFRCRFSRKKLIHCLMAFGGFSKTQWPYSSVFPTSEETHSGNKGWIGEAWSVWMGNSTQNSYALILKNN
jgi:hypothetical protein